MAFWFFAAVAASIAAVVGGAGYESFAAGAIFTLIAALAWFVIAVALVAPPEEEPEPEYVPEPVQQAAPEVPQGPPPWMLRGFDDDHADLLPPSAPPPNNAPEAW